MKKSTQYSTWARWVVQNVEGVPNCRTQDKTTYKQYSSLARWASQIAERGVEFHALINQTMHTVQHFKKPRCPKCGRDCQSPQVEARQSVNGTVLQQHLLAKVWEGVQFPEVIVNKMPKGTALQHHQGAKVWKGCEICSSDTRRCKRCNRTFQVIRPRKGRNRWVH